jgi:predicted peroxiredoxin
MRYKGMTKKKLVVIATHGAEDPDRATIPFVMANAALASEIETVVILQSTAVMLAMKDFAKHVHSQGFPPLDELIMTYKDLGGSILACVPCLKSRGIPEDQLIEGTKQVAAATVISETTGADTTLTY